MKNFFKSRELLSIFFWIIIFLIIFFISEVFWLFSWINERITSNLSKLTYSFRESSINDNIVVVTIDEPTLAEFWFPFPRKYYKNVIENLNNSWASVIWMDIIFANEDKLNPESDNLFAESIKKAWNVILWWWLYSEKSWNKNLILIEKPLEKFYKNIYGFWYFQPNLSKNNVVIWFSPSYKISDKNFVITEYNQFSISLLKAYYWKKYWKNFNDYFKKDKHKFYLRPNDTNWIPFSYSWSNEVLINFLPIPKWKSSAFPTYSFLDVYNNNFSPDIFNDKIVIIWYTAKWLKDTFLTRNWTEYWVFVHANIINTILTKNFLVYFDKYLEWFLIFLLIVTSFYFSLSRFWYTIILSNFSIGILFLVIYPSISMIFSWYILNHMFELFLALPFSIAIWNSIKYLFENKNKLKLSKALSEYVSKAIVNEILSNSWDLKLDWDLKKLSIFFSDIEWFTSISEKFSPQDLVHFLRDYLSNMSNIILDNKWFINKYEWDAIMALWWAFSNKNNEKNSYNACLSAINQQKLLKELNKSWEKNWLPEIKVRIWIHTWRAIVWNIWAVWRKIEYTALWDAVNLASRLEWVNKFYWTFICVSEDIYKENKENFDFRFLDEITVKWKEKSIKIYELLSLKWELTEEKKELVKDFKSAMDKYFSKDFNEAKKMFENIYEKFLDWPSKTYISRCDYFLENPLKNDSDFIWKFDSK